MTPYNGASNKLVAYKVQIQFQTALLACSGHEYSIIDENDAFLKFKHFVMKLFTVVITGHAGKDTCLVCYGSRM